MKEVSRNKSCTTDGKLKGQKWRDETLINYYGRSDSVFIKLQYDHRFRSSRKKKIRKLRYVRNLLNN